MAIPSYPCYNSCLEMQNLCRPTFSSFGIPLPPWCALTLQEVNARGRTLTLASPPAEFIYDFTAEGGTNVTANCSAFSSNGASADVTCPQSYALFGRTST